MRDTVLSVRDLNICIGGQRGVRDVSFDIPRGECCALVGESGSGKTLTALSITDLLPEGVKRTSGELTFSDGQGERRLDTLSPREWRAVRGAGISMVFQDPTSSLTPTMRIGTMLEETLRAHQRISAGQARAKAVQALEKVGIPSPEEALRRYPHAFSGGQRQRIVIAGAVICEPSLVIADEPTTALDVLSQGKIMEIFKLLAKGGASVMLITHNLALCENLCEGICVMYAGQIVERGRVADVFRSPAHPYTKALLRCVPVPGSREELYEIPPSRRKWDGQGCAFYGRCPRAKPRCRVESPAERALGDGHYVRCGVHPAS